MSLTRKLAWNFESLVRNALVRVPPAKTPNKRSEIMVSLTTYPARVGTLWKTLETIYRQSVEPSFVVLVLSQEEFPNRCLPQSIEKYLDRGMNVLYVSGNIRSYKKLIPVIERFPSATIVTADDDVLYPRHWLRDLVIAHEKEPEAIVGHRGTVISGDQTGLLPYIRWPQAGVESAPSRVFLTGMGGILYPPGSLNHEHTTDMSLAMRLAPTGDDIWFKAMSLMAGTRVIKVSNKRGDFSTVRSAQKTALRKVNVLEGANDLQFAAVMNHFDLWGRL